jgi:catechol 2,3-dioxygenase-like lactoylglutathione lyase family enzyme
MFVWPASVSWAQLSASNKSGVSMGHVHYHVRDVEAHKRFWTALGAQLIKFGETDVMKFPDILIFLTRAVANGSTEGSVVSHVAFKVADLAPVVAALEKAGQKVPQRPAQAGRTPDVQMVHTPEGDAVEIFNGNREIVRFTPDPGHGDPTAHRHNRPMSVPIATHHLHIYVPEGADEQARDWYVRMFGAIPGIRFRYKAADLPGMTMNFLGQPAALSPTKGRSLDHIGFEVRGLEAFCKALEEKGVKFDIPFTKRPDGIATAFLTDSWGTYIELTEGLNGL